MISVPIDGLFSYLSNETKIVQFWHDAELQMKYCLMRWSNLSLILFYLEVRITPSPL